jgi:hypothetical protein
VVCRNASPHASNTPRCCALLLAAPVVLILATASAAVAQPSSAADAAQPAAAQSAVPSRRDGSRVPGNWGVTFWGVSYHIDKSLEYNGQNWGLGIRHYSRPDWRWLGASEETRTFIEVDALKNSWKGLVLPVSAGVEYKIAGLSETCSLFAVATMTVAYYHNAVKDVSNLRYGPVPGLVMGCGHVRSNAVFVLSPKSILGVVAGSWTIVF